MSNMKNFSVIALLFVSLVIMATGALALTAGYLSTSMNDRNLQVAGGNGPFAFNKDRQFEIRTTFNLTGSAGQVFNNVQVEATIDLLIITMASNLT